MIVLKPFIIDPSQWLEAAWVDRIQLPDVEIPATDTEPARTEPGAIAEAQIQCVSYHPTQIDMLRADAARLGTPLDDREAELAAWVAAHTPPPPPPPPSPEEIQAEIVVSTQKRLDDFARTRLYDGNLSACTYATSSVPKFKTEGQYCVHARDATWAKLYQMLAEVEAGTRPVPTGYADIEPELPVLAWPN